MTYDEYLRVKARSASASAVGRGASNMRNGQQAGSGRGLATPGGPGGQAGRIRVNLDADPNRIPSGRPLAGNGVTSGRGAATSGVEEGEGRACAIDDQQQPGVQAIKSRLDSIIKAHSTPPPLPTPIKPHSTPPPLPIPIKPHSNPSFPLAPTVASNGATAVAVALIPPPSGTPITPLCAPRPTTAGAATDAAASTTATAASTTATAASTTATADASGEAAAADDSETDSGVALLENEAHVLVAKRQARQERIRRIAAR